MTGVLIRAGPIKAETEGECYVKTETGGISVYKPRDPKECWLSPELGERHQTFSPTEGTMLAETLRFGLLAPRTGIQ